MSESNKVKHCKKCQRELPSDTKGKLCDYCRKERNRKAKKIGAGVGAGVLTFGGVVVKAIINRKNENS